jgi:hypothetical protein
MEPWPEFGNRLKWYTTKVLPPIKDPHRELGYASHLDACNTAYENAGCKWLKGTHEGRREGCKLAEMTGVPDAETRRLGRWDRSRMAQHYSTGLPRQGARVLAGHGADAGIFPPLFWILVNEIQGTTFWIANVLCLLWNYKE